VPTSELSPYFRITDAVTRISSLGSNGRSNRFEPAGDSQRNSLGLIASCRARRIARTRCRPLHARVASDNVGSRRVLEKCGFRVIATERSFAEARSAEVEELVLRLEESGSAA
jgi:hypothetical protein